jgi:hypothetical protein
MTLQTKHDSFKRSKAGIQETFEEVLYPACAGMAQGSNAIPSEKAAPMCKEAGSKKIGNKPAEAGCITNSECSHVVILKLILL